MIIAQETADYELQLTMVINRAGHSKLPDCEIPHLCWFGHLRAFHPINNEETIVEGSARPQRRHEDACLMLSDMGAVIGA